SGSIEPACGGAVSVGGGPGAAAAGNRGAAAAGGPDADGAVHAGARVLLDRPNGSARGRKSIMRLAAHQQRIACQHLVKFEPRDILTQKRTCPAAMLKMAASA